MISFYRECSSAGVVFSFLLSSPLALHVLIRPKVIQVDQIPQAVSSAVVLTEFQFFTRSWHRNCNFRVRWWPVLVEARWRWAVGRARRVGWAVWKARMTWRGAVEDPCLMSIKPPVVRNGCYLARWRWNRLASPRWVWHRFSCRDLAFDEIENLRWFAT